MAEDWMSAMQRLTTGGFPQDTALTTDPGGAFGGLRSRTERSEGPGVEAVPLGEDPVSIIISILMPLLRGLKMPGATSASAPATLRGSDLPRSLLDISRTRTPTQAITPEMVGNISTVWPREPIERDLFNMLAQLNRTKGQATPKQFQSGYYESDVWDMNIKDLLDMYKRQ